MPYYRNKAQRVYILAIDTSTGDKATGEALNITAKWFKDTVSASTTDTNPTELDATNAPGAYYFEITATEFDCSDFYMESTCSTAGVEIDPVTGTTIQGMVFGEAVTGTLSSTSCTTNLTEATDDAYNDGVIVWLSGVLTGQKLAITDYNGTTKTLTYEATKTGESPSNGDEFVIV